MKHGVISFSAALAAFLVTPLLVRADANPDFDDDAKPILRSQPGLLQYVESRFEVKDTGTAKFPGDDDRRPGPPYIFRARPIGSHGPFTLRLLIQPGTPGHVLGVVDITKVHPNQPGPQPPQQPVVSQAPDQGQNDPFAPPASYHPPAYSQPPAPAAAQEPAPTQEPAPAPEPAAKQPSEPTADTPSGPIMDSGSQSSGSTVQPQQSLAPPPDPAPAAQ